MADGGPDHSEAQRLLALAEALNRMRDLLVEVSLLLQDARFDVDTAQRDAAARQSQALFDKVNHR